MSNKANQESICTNGTRNTLQSPQGTENRAGTQTLVDTSAAQKARDLYIQAESCHDRAVPPAEQAAPKAAPADALDEAMRERDEAEDFIDALLDEVLGCERPEWSNLYGRYDAMSDVQERMTALHKPAVDKAWGQFQSAMAAPQPAPAPLSDDVAKDAARWRMVALIGNEVMLHPEKRTQAAAVKAYMDATHSGSDLTGAVDAALAAQGGKDE